MRVCMLAYSFYESDTRVQQYATALVERGDEVDVVAIRRPGAPTREVLDGVNVHRIQTRRVNEQTQIAYLFRIARFMFLAAFFTTVKHVRNRYQAIHVHSVPDFLVFAALVPKLLGARVILDIHDILPEFYASKFHARPDSLLFKLMLLLERCSVAFANYTIIANDLWYERLKARSAKDGKCMAIRNYPDPALFVAPPTTPKNGRFRILYPGTLLHHQGLDVAIKAFGKIKDRLPDAEFLIYGEGPAKPELMALTGQIGLEGRVLFKEIVPTDEIVKVMAGADLAVVPKRASSPFGNEAASTKIFEFMALGVPVVVSRTAVDTHYFDDSLVKFFESENEDDLANAILAMARDQELREQFAARAGRYAAEHSWDVKKLEYLQLVDKLVGSKLAARSESRC